MGTGTDNRITEEINCEVCHKVYTPQCDYKQGRCPHNKPMIQFDFQPKDTGRGHFYVSIAKSAVRLAAGIALIMVGFALPGCLFILAEILGIVEELV